jgi:hypothetical protein
MDTDQANSAIEFYDIVGFEQTGCQHLPAFNRRPANRTQTVLEFRPFLVLDLKEIQSVFVYIPKDSHLPNRSRGIRP